MKYFAALAAREDATVRCLFARQQLRASAHEVSDVYRAYPLPALASAAAVWSFVTRKRSAAQRYQMAFSESESVITTTRLLWPGPAAPNLMRI